jgi:Ca2+/Na+ antiporter
MITAAAVSVQFVALIWGGILASRQIREKAGYMSSPDGVILILLMVVLVGFVLSLLVDISVWASMFICVPVFVWVYVAILTHRTARNRATES